MASYFTFNNRQTNSRVGERSFSEGINSIASGYGAHAEGYETEAKGAYSHVEGIGTLASGDCSHAEGRFTKALGDRAHVEGSYSKAIGWNSHAAGEYAQVWATNGHAFGEHTFAGTKNSLVIGRYNYVISPEYDEDGYITKYTVGPEYPFVIGNGTSETERSDAMYVTWSGMIHAQGLNDIIDVGNVKKLISSYAAGTQQHTIEMILKAICTKYPGLTNQRFIGYGQFIFGQYAVPVDNNIYVDFMVRITSTKSNDLINGLPASATGIFNCFPNVVSSFYCSEGIVHINSAGSPNEIYVGDITDYVIQSSRYKLTTSSNDSEWLKYLLNVLCVGYRGCKDTIFKGILKPNSTGYFEIFIYDTSITQGSPLLPQYSHGTWKKWQNTFALVSTNSYNFSYVTK